MSTTMPTTMPMTTPIKADHEIIITLQGNQVFGPDSLPTMAVGETVRYSSSVPGKLRIVFPQRSPFRTDNAFGTEVPGEVILTLVSDSAGDTLEGRCFITPDDPPGAPEVGWNSLNNAQAGVHQKVTPPS